MGVILSVKVLASIYSTLKKERKRKLPKFNGKMLGSTPAAKGSQKVAQPPWSDSRNVKGENHSSLLWWCTRVILCSGNIRQAGPNIAIHPGLVRGSFKIKNNNRLGKLS